MFVSSSRRAVFRTLNSARSLQVFSKNLQNRSRYISSSTLFAQTYVASSKYPKFSSKVAVPACSSPLIHQQVRSYADYVMVKTPHMADSITEGTLKTWHKNVGDFVAADEEVATIETDKVDVAVNAPTSGVIAEVLAKEEDTVIVGSDLFKIEKKDAPPEGAAPPVEAPKPATPIPEPAKNATPPSPPPSPQTTAAPPKPAAPSPAPPKPSTQPSSTTVSSPSGARTENKVKMTRMRMRISERLKESQNTAASLTTFNEIDMSNIMEMRNKYKDAVLKKHNVKLGFMSAFVKASVYAMEHVPVINARVEDEYIVYPDYVDISVAVATPKGLVTPVLRDCQNMSFVDVEKTISGLGEKARDNKITIEDMAGGTFTISNGGVFGSLYGTPIINLPQSAILGMHAVKERPVVVDGKVFDIPAIVTDTGYFSSLNNFYFRLKFGP
ncbi:hypothetical protein BKA69DRAFT_1051171 [Paraphysoderma sedebokerense]|nr:hypothetical protein BKA69DRAFT_1051171 [Paraphysoderma sedebokerense]